MDFLFIFAKCLTIILFIMKIFRSVCFFVVGLWLLLMGVGAMNGVFEFFKDECFYSSQIYDKSGANDAYYMVRAIEDVYNHQTIIGKMMFAISGCVLILCSIPKESRKKEE